MDTIEQDEIAQLAYRYYEERGGAEGEADADWLRAEAEIRSRKEAEALGE